MPTRTRIALAAIAALTMVAITIVGAVGVARAPDRSDPATALVVMLVGGAIASGLLGVVLLVPAERQRRATVDMLGRERARRRGAELRYETLVHELPAGVVRTDEHGEFRYVNERWTELTGLTLDNARDWRSVVHPDDRHLFATLQRGNGERSPVTSRHRLRRADGAERWVQSRVVPMYDPTSNAFAGWLGAVTDIHEEVLMRQELAESRAQLQGIFDKMVDAVIVTDDHGFICDVNQAAASLFGYDEAEMLGNNVTMLIPDGQHRHGHDGYLKAFREAGKLTKLARGRSLTAMRKDHSTFPIHLAIGVSGEGAGLRCTAIIRDLTAELEAERQMLRNAMEQQALHEMATLVATQAPVDEVCVAAVRQICWVLDVPMAMVLRRVSETAAEVVESLAPEAGEIASPGVIVELRDGDVCSRAIARADGAFGPCPEQLRPQPDLGARDVLAVPIIVGDVPWGLLLVLADEPTTRRIHNPVSSFAQLISTSLSGEDTRRRMEELAETDHLTGLPNRRAYKERLRDEIERSRRQGHELCLVLIDIDHFKSVNDTHGHDIGDRVLVMLANALRSTTRTGELVARLGGEEFGWILPETPVEEARIAAERARALVADLDIPGAGPVTISLGVCALCDAPDADELYRRADGALYRAKAAGRNRVLAFGDVLGSVSR
ncbi:MAG: diguanylate cyclase [Thermoleophilia bacterium]